MAPQAGFEPATLRLTAPAAIFAVAGVRNLVPSRDPWDRRAIRAASYGRTFHWRVPARLTAWLRSWRSLTWWPTSLSVDDARDPVGETHTPFATGPPLVFHTRGAPWPP